MKIDEFIKMCDCEEVLSCKTSSKIIGLTFYDLKGEETWEYFTTYSFYNRRPDNVRIWKVYNKFGITKEIVFERGMQKHRFVRIPTIEDIIEECKVRLPKNQESYGEDCHNLVILFRNWMINTDWQYIISLKSMRKLWIAYYMQTEHNKLWNSETKQWVRCNA